MTNVTKILVSLIVAGIASSAEISVAQAITITNGPYQFESLDFAPSGTGLENYNVGPDDLTLSEKLIDCDLDPNRCGATTSASGGNAAGSTSAKNTAITTGSTAGGATEISEPTALLLVILGLIGLSRLRGKPIE